MRRIPLLVLALGWLGAGQLALAQAAQTAAPRPASRVELKASDTTRGFTAGKAASTGAPAALAVAAPVSPPATARMKKQQNTKPTDSSNKNPYWEPRDWNYIAEQGP
jgi:hypothetical protein